MFDRSQHFEIIPRLYDKPVNFSFIDGIHGCFRVCQTCQHDSYRIRPSVFYNIEKFRPVLRRAILLALLGYGSFIVSLIFDLGLPWRIYMPVISWQHHSVMFEIAWCVMLYFTVLILEFGPVILKSEPFTFTETDYYTDEMGGRLSRLFVGFERFIEKDRIADIKHATIDIERRIFSEGGGRDVNIDPGYLTSAKVVLPTTKNFQHRIYLRDGIFAEVTLRYRRDSFGGWEWTYPDYLRPDSIRFFNRFRERYRERVRGEAEPRSRGSSGY